MRNGNDPLMDAALAEVLGGVEAPDLSARILARSQEQPAQRIASVERQSAIWRSRIFRGLEFLAAAAVVSLIAWLVWFADKTPATNMHADVAEPKFVKAAPEADFEFKGGVVEFKRGWLVVETGASIIRAADTTISDVNGRADLKDGAAPGAVEIEAMRPWLKENRVEEAMLKNSKRWLVRGAIALCVLSGSVMVDGVNIRAEAENPEGPEMPDEPEDGIVDSADDLAELSADTRELTCLRLKDEDLAGLRRFTKLTSLSFTTEDYINDPKNSVEITDKGLAVVAELKTLRHLNLSHAIEITAEGLAKLADLPRLEALNLMHTKFSGAMLANLVKFPVLRELDLSGARFDSGNSGDFVALAEMPALRSLGLVRCDWVNDTVMACIAKCARLDDLNIEQCFNISDEGVRSFAGLSNLTELRIGGSSTLHITPARDHDGPHSKLLYLNVSSEAWAVAIKGMNNLRVLKLDSCKGVDDSVLAAIAASCSRLEQLNLHSCCIITDVGVAALKGLPLQGLDLSYCGRLTDASLKAISEMPSLAALVLYSANQVGGFGDSKDKDAWLLSAIAEYSNEGMAALAKCEKLHSLDISYTHGITGEGFKALAGLKTLRCLNVAHDSGITDAVIADVISTMTWLSVLDISYCENLTEAAAEQLGKLVNLDRLIIARTYNVPMFSAATREKLRKALPETEITTRR